MLERIRRPSSTTAAAVSSQEVSIARIRMGGLSNFASLLVEGLAILGFLQVKCLSNNVSLLLQAIPNPWEILPVLPSCHPGAPKGSFQDAPLCLSQDNIIQARW